MLLLRAAMVSGQTGVAFTQVLWVSMTFQVLVMSVTSFMVWFWLLRIYLASRLGVLSFMTPIFGIAFGVWLLDEPLTVNFVAGAVLVLAGIPVVSGHGWFRQKLGSRSWACVCF